MILMKRAIALLVGAAAILFGHSLTAEMKPADGAPVFRIFTSPPGGGSPDSAINLNGKKPLMIVTAVSDVAVSRDRKAVRVILNSADARRFADIIRKHPNDLLVLEANGRVLEAMRASGPVTNGVLEFVYPDDATVADYLKKRFRLK